jgi:hypothetical protein
MPAHNRIRISTSEQILLAAFIVSFLALRPSHPQSNQPASLFHEDVLAELTPGAEAKFVLVGNHHLAWVEKQNDKRTLHLDGKQIGGSFDDIKYLQFSRDESRLAFFGKRSSEWLFVLDGQEHSNRYTTPTAISFQPDGDSFAYCECKGKKCRLVVDGAETGAEYDDISYPQYSPDGKRIAFLAKRSKKWVAIVDGKELGSDLDEIWSTSWGFSRGGGRFFFSGRVKSFWVHVVDGSPTPGFEIISPIAFSRDGKHYAYGGADSKGGFKKQKIFGTIVKDGQTIATYEGKGMAGSWSALGGSTETMVGGIHDLTTDFHGVSTPEFDPNGKLVYAARRDKGDVAVFQGSDAGPGFDEILSPIIFTEDSQHFAYVARRGQDFVEVRDNGSILAIHAGKRGATSVGWIAISLDASHLAYETISGGRYFKAAGTLRAYRTAIVDGQSGPDYNALGLADFGFDPDSHHFFYAVIGAEGDRDLVNIDGHESRIYDAVANTRYMPDGKTIAFVARDGSRFLRVTFALSPATSLPAVSTAALLGSGSPGSRDEHLNSSSAFSQ